jgi:hypothetical protein
MKKTVLLLSVFSVMVGSAFAQVSGLDLLVHYPFQGYSTDASGNGRNAQTAHTWYETGANGVANYSIAVDGDSASTIAYDYSSDWNAFNFQSFTISTWARFDDLQTAYSNIFEMGNGQVFLRLQNQGGSLAYPEFGVLTTGGNFVGSGTLTGQALSFWQQWHHFALTSELDWSGTQRTFKLYIDGSLYQTENINGTMTTEATISHNAVGNGATAINIGYRPSNSILATNGNFQDFFLYARAVPATEVGDLYNHLCYPSYAAIDTIACDSYTLNGQSYYQSGTYTQTIPKADGCDSIITLNLTLFETPYAEIIENGQQLEATSTAEMYQWVDCINGVVIPNSDSQYFTPTVAGEYAVVLINGTCYMASDCFAFTLGLEESDLFDVTLYPNPASQFVSVNGLTRKASFRLVDAIGREVLNQTVSPEMSTVNIGSVAKGIYNVIIGQTVQQHLIIQ